MHLTLGQDAQIETCDRSSHLTLRRNGPVEGPHSGTRRVSLLPTFASALILLAVRSNWDRQRLPCNDALRELLDRDFDLEFARLRTIQRP